MMESNRLTFRFYNKAMAISIKKGVSAIRSSWSPEPRGQAMLLTVMAIVFRGRNPNPLGNTRNPLALGRILPGDFRGTVTHIRSHAGSDRFTSVAR